MSSSQPPEVTDTMAAGDQEEQSSADSPQRRTPPTPLAKKLADIMPQILPGMTLITSETCKRQGTLPRASLNISLPCCMRLDFVNERRL